MTSSALEENKEEKSAFMSTVNLLLFVLVQKPFPCPSLSGLELQNEQDYLMFSFINFPWNKQAFNSKLFGIIKLKLLLLMLVIVAFRAVGCGGRGEDGGGLSILLVPCLTTRFLLFWIFIYLFIFLVKECIIP